MSSAGTSGIDVAALAAELAKVRKQLASERTRHKAWERRVVTRLGALEAAHVLLAGTVEGIEDDVALGDAEFASWKSAFEVTSAKVEARLAATAGHPVQPRTAPRQSRVRGGVEVHLVPTG